jgi:hypothetical protein
VALEEGKESKSSHFLTIRRIVWGVVGLTWFLWIGYEDRSLTPILILSALISYAIGLEIRLRQRQKLDRVKLETVLRLMAVGVFAGAIVGPMAVLLALLKTSLHQHAVTDFSTDDLILLVRGVPVWALSGTFFGAAAAILGWAKDFKR